jgi:hypothetical protein
VIQFLGVYLKEYKPGYNRDTCTSMFIVSLFIIGKLWKQPRCPTTDKWIKKIWYVYSVEYYLAIKKNKIMLFAGKWMEVDISFLLGHYLLHGGIHSDNSD